MALISWEKYVGIYKGSDVCNFKSTEHICNIVIQNAAKGFLNNNY